MLFSKITKARPKAYCDRNFLQKEADFKKLKSSLVMKQKWVPYPDYDDRDGWNRFWDHTKMIIYAGEKLVWVMYGKL